LSADIFPEILSHKAKGLTFMTANLAINAAGTRESTQDGIPILDLSAYLAGSEGALAALAAELRYALENVGFFYIANHPVPPDLIECMFEETRRFHSLPLDTKMAIHLNRSNNGYMPLKGHAQHHSVLNKDPKPNENESFFARRERDPEDPDVKAGKDLRDPNQWPDGLPGFRETVLDYMKTMEAFCLKLLPVYATALELPADFFAPYFRESETTVRMIHYPPAGAADAAGNVFGTAAHTDRNFSTFLPPANAPGLNILSQKGEWIPAPSIPGTYLVNAGDTLRRWTNDRFLSTAHRVFNDSGMDRYSVPFFHAPNLNAMIEALPTCTDAAHPPNYPATSYEDMQLEFLNKNYFNRQKYTEGAATTH
jgi:isopenicillin N synthase-like dioxygenase